MRAAVICVLLLGSATLNAQDIPIRQIVVPTYPLLGRDARLQGRVRMDLEIGEDGKVQSVRSSGAHILLLDESEKNIRQWTFGPYPEGTRFPVRWVVRYEYKLEGEEEYRMSPPRVVITLPNDVQIVARPPLNISIAD